MTAQFGFGKYRFSGQIWVIFLAAIVSAFGFSIVFPFLAIYLTAEMMLGETLTGIVMLCYMVTGTVFMLFGGAWADKVGRKRIMVVSLAGEGVTLSLYAFASEFWQFVAIALSEGAIGSLYYPAANAMIADLAPSGRRAEAYSLIRIAFNFGMATGPLLGSVLILTFDLRKMFIISALVVGMALMLVYARTRETLATTSAQRIMFDDIRGVTRDRTFILFCVCIATYSFTFAQLFSSLPVYASADLEIPKNLIALIFSVNAGMVVLLQISVTAQAIKVRRTSALASGQALMALGIGLIFLASDFAGLIAAIVVFTFGELLYSAILYALIADLSPERLRGTYMGFTGLVFGVGEGVGVLTGMMLLELLPVRALVWVIIAVASVPASIGLILLRRRIPKSVDRGLAVQEGVEGQGTIRK